MGDTEDGLKPKKLVFVTVGTTCFDALVRAMDAQTVKQELVRRGYTHLLIQMGRGSYFPTKSGGGNGSIAVDYFTFSSSIADLLRSASLVISHAGSGSIFETLRLAKPLIVVVNEDLMDNHQSELAVELEERKHLYCARPHTLHQTIADMNLESLIPYSPGDATPIAKIINRACEKAVRKALCKIKGVRCVEIEAALKKITVLGNMDRKVIVKAVRKTGRRAELWASSSSSFSSCHCRQEDPPSPKPAASGFWLSCF
ncbi:hypothetical protein FNV43_RR20010 [Rhamnella rubrinervis]|uniref:HMA domain-containing protein n=1 Tax=Rhamnella rubrinervis TaxID=2594499 RepID=A0A8K0E5M8_9ROSA|nr:hypothetical protein FNV43_RR20010 [Rhamnella rubrinervis]